MATATGQDDSPVSGIILAGGRSRRLGRDKALEPIGGQPLIWRVIERVSQAVDEVVIVVADAARADQLPLPPGCRLAVDIYPGKGSLGGVFTGLRAAAYPWALAVACDMPFLNVALLRYLLSLRADHTDAIVPLRDGRPEPTHALYHQRCLPAIERKLLADDLRTAGFLTDARTRYVPQADLTPFDPDLLSFFNLNTPQDLAEARRLAALGR